MLKELDKWIPWKIAPGLRCTWLYVQNKTYTEPFFDDTIGVCRRFDQNRSAFKSTSTLETMEQWGCRINSASPAAIIFHVSRCGSTLLTQLLSCDSTNIVLSEVPFFDELLRLPFKQQQIDQDIINKYLLSATRLYAQPFYKKDSSLFIKADSWHIHFYEQVRSIFPTTKFILLYRNPFEVLLSQKRQRGLQSVPGLLEPEIFGFKPCQINVTDFDQYMSTVLETYFKKMISISKSDPLSFAFNYSEGIKNITKQVYKILDHPLSHDVEEQWFERCRYHAKHPSQLFDELPSIIDPPAYLKPVLKLYNELDLLSTLKRQLVNDIPE